MGSFLPDLEIVASHTTFSHGRFPNARHRNALCHIAYELPPGFSSVENPTQNGWFGIGTESQKPQHIVIFLCDDTIYSFDRD